MAGAKVVGGDGSTPFSELTVVLDHMRTSCARARTALEKFYEANAKLTNASRKARSIPGLTLVNEYQVPLISTTEVLVAAMVMLRRLLDPLMAEFKHRKRSATLLVYLMDTYLKDASALVVEFESLFSERVGLGDMFYDTASLSDYPDAAISSLAEIPHRRWAREELG